MEKVAKNNTSLKITYSNKIKHDIDYYFGKHFKVKTIITDADGDKYESEILCNLIGVKSSLRMLKL